MTDCYSKKPSSDFQFEDRAASQGAFACAGDAGVSMHADGANAAVAAVTPAAGTPAAAASP